MATTIVLVGLGLFVVLQATKGPLVHVLGIGGTQSSSGASGSSSSGGGVSVPSALNPWDWFTNPLGQIGSGLGVSGL